jgi:hypothetical protein
MRFRAQVQSQKLDSYTNKKGQVISRQLLMMQDKSEEGGRLDMPFEYFLSIEEEGMHSVSLVDQFVLLDVTALTPAFGGKLRAAGAIVEVL